MRRAVVTLLAAGAALAVPAAASAETFCVNDTSCPADHRFTSIQAAFDAAHANGDSIRDRIQIGPGDYAESNLSDNSGNVVDVVGAGRSATRLARAPGNAVTTLAMAEPTSTVQDLTIRTATGSGNTALGLAGTATRVDLVGDNAGDAGVSGSSSTTFQSGTITLSGSDSVGAAGIGANLVDATVLAHTGAVSPTSLVRCRITAVFGIVPFVGLGSIPATIRDSVLRMPPGAANGTAVQTLGGFGPGDVTMTGTTLVGAGANATGLSVAADGSSAITSSTATANVDGVIFRGFTTDIRRNATAGSSGRNATAQVNIDYSIYDPAKVASANQDASSGGGTATGAVTDGGHNVNADPRFVDEGAGDYRLRGSSPAVDHGHAGTGAGATDLAGSPRVVDGNGDGNPVVDMGAVEYLRRAPAVSATPPAGGTVGSPVSFSGSATDPDGEGVTLAWTFGDGTGAPGGAVSHAYPRAGAHTATLTATDEGGASASTSVPVVVAALPRPVVSGLSLTHSKFTWGPGATAISAARRRAVPRGTTFRFRLSAAATVKIVLASVRSGRRVGRRCLAPTRARRGRRRCTRYVTVGTLTRRNRRTGANRVAFSGRLGRRRLPAGRYRATLTATAVGARASVPRRVAFRIVAP